jgi:hypothetical protein
VGVIIILLFVLAALFVLNSIQNEPVVVPVEEPIMTPDEPDEPIVVEDKPITQGLDTDSDGLTDVEELLYGTDFRNPDTDADSFLDGNEVFHRYDPIGYAPSTLLDTGSVEIYSALGVPTYEVYYPSTWTAQDSFDPGTGMTSEVTFASRTGSVIGISTFTPSPEADIVFSHVDLGKALDIVEFFQSTSKEGYTVYSSQDKLTSYLYGEGDIFQFRYDLEREKTIEYLQTFQMMVNSFVLP